MAVGFPAKTSFADGVVLPASDLNDLGGTLNLVGVTSLNSGGQIMSGNVAVTVTATNGSSTSFSVTFPRTFTGNTASGQIQIVFSSVIATNPATNNVLGYCSAQPSTTSASCYALRLYGSTTSGITLVWIATNVN